MRAISCWTRLALLVCVLMAVTGCGQKGDLYMPEGETNLIAAG
jgi:predicted small lipoprotein YifL